MITKDIVTVKTNIDLLDDTITLARRDKIYTFFFGWLGINDANLHVLLEPLCNASRAFTQPLFREAFDYSLKKLQRYWPNSKIYRICDPLQFI